MHKSILVCDFLHKIDKDFYRILQNKNKIKSFSVYDKRNGR